MGSLVTRPWNKGTAFNNLEPDILGQFDTYEDWINHATRALTGPEFEGKYGSIPAVCIDDIGRRCTCGGDFMRARDERTFPVRYFTSFKSI